MQNKGWRVTFAGMGINLALGVLYTWSVIKKAIPSEWDWSDSEKALPYSIACIVFSIVMVPAGRLQDRIGPRWVATAGGVLTGTGCIIASYATTLLWFVVGHPQRTYLWVLSRTKTMDDALYDAILGRLREQGYVTTRLIKTVQE